MMNRLFCVTIDVEPDCDISWRRSVPLAFDNITMGINSILHPLLQDCGVKPTYFISPEVLRHQGSVGVLGDLQGCELGTHLHAEYVEPELQYPNPAGTSSKTFPCQLASAVEQAKLETITKLYRDAFGCQPASYRAARFGADDDTFRFLVELGYRVDSSVTPGINWQDRGGPDFRSFSHQPYWIYPGKLLEIPVTIAGKRGPWLPEKWMWYKWLRPSTMCLWELKRLVDCAVQQKADFAVLNMMFHSMEILPGKTPYVRTRWGQKLFLRRLEKTIKYILAKGFAAKTLVEIHEEKLREISDGNN